MRIFIFLLMSILLLVANAGSICAQKPAKPSKPTTRIQKADSKFLKTEDLRIHYLEWNRSGQQTIVILHGLYDTAKTWEKVAPLLAEHGFRVIAPDRRGSGRTTKPQAGYDIETLSNDIFEIVKVLQLREPVIVGHSAGASVALTAGTLKPELFRSVVLVDGGFWPTREQTDESGQQTPACAKRRKTCDRESAINKGNMQYNPEELYPKLSLPVLLLMATPNSINDQLSAEMLSEMKTHVETVASRKLKNGKLFVIPNSGHWIQTDQPASVANAVVEFIASTSPKTMPYDEPADLH